jgi:hypothetical protein
MWEKVAETTVKKSGNVSVSRIAEGKGAKRFANDLD